MELSIDTTPEAVDWVRTLLAETSYAGDVQVTQYAEAAARSEDAAAAAWAFTIRLYLPDDNQASAQAAAIDQLLSPLQRTGLATALATTVVAEKPTLAAAGHRIGNRFVVLAPDTPYRSQTPDEVTLRLKSTLAFGSGLHPATALSLQLLERHVLPKMNALDLGSGSGILSVAMAKLGAQVLALDNDCTAVWATQDAIARNGVAQQVSVTAGSLGQGSDFGHWMGGDIRSTVASVQPTASFDLIVANILARVHIALAHDFRQALRRTAAHTERLIVAGFTADYEADVDAALTAAGFAVVDRERSHEWVALAYRLID
jgi:ribosomal protein L11 methyltransferase